MNCSMNRRRRPPSNLKILKILEMKSNVRAVTPKAEDKPQSVDREKTCPLLLRVFTSKGKFNF